MNNQMVQCTLKKKTETGTLFTTVWLEESKLKNQNGVTIRGEETPWQVHEVFRGIRGDLA